MRNKYLIYFILQLLLVTSCQTKEKNDFLNFKLGMTKSDFFQNLDTLVNNKTIYSYGKDYYYDFEISSSLKINSKLSYEFKDDALTEIGLWLGHRRLNLLSNPNETYAIDDCLEPKEIQSVFSLYKSKYGNPDGYHSEGYAFWKKSKNVEVRFSTGYKNQYTCDTTKYLMGSFIIYQYDSTYQSKKGMGELFEKAKKMKDII